MTLAITLSGTAQAIGYLVLLLAVSLAAGYAWYRLVTFPRFQRQGRKLGQVVAGENLFGDHLLEEWDEHSFRPHTFREWLRRVDRPSD